MNKIHYRTGYKYQLARDYAVNVAIRPYDTIYTEFVCLNNKGLLVIRSGYAWDGASGPAIDSQNLIRGSLTHDALYQLMREGYLSPSWRRQIDEELRRICLEDGMSKIRAWWVYHAVRIFGGPCADPENKRPIIEAP